MRHYSASASHHRLLVIVKFSRFFLLALMEHIRESGIRKNSGGHAYPDETHSAAPQSPHRLLTMPAATTAAGVYEHNAPLPHAQVRQMPFSNMCR